MDFLFSCGKSISLLSFFVIKYFNPLGFEIPQKHTSLKRPLTFHHFNFSLERLILMYIRTLFRVNLFTSEIIESPYWHAGTKNAFLTPPYATGAAATRDIVQWNLQKHSIAISTCFGGDDFRMFLWRTFSPI
jgi:hypothetical protein